MNLSRAVSLPALLVGVLLSGSASGQPTAAPTPAALVRQLGSDSFEVREQAAGQLEKLGRAGVPALEAGLKDADREVSTRCEGLLQLARRSNVEVELEAFVLGQRDARAEPLTGWKRFRDLAGEDLSSRLLFVQLYRTDKSLLEMLERNPAQLAGQLLNRGRQLQQKFNAVQVKPISATAEVNGFLLAGCLASIDTNQFYQITNVFYNRAVLLELRQSPASRRLAGRILSMRIDNPNVLNQATNLAAYLGLQDAVDARLKQVVKKQVEDAAKAADLNRLQQYAYLASNLAMTDLINSTIRPALRKLAESAAQGSDINRMQQAAMMAQTLQLRDITDGILRPAASKHILAAAEHVSDTSRFYQARYLAQLMGLTDLFESVMRPAAVRVILESADNPGDQTRFYNALNLAQNLHMPEALEGVLRPAGRRLILEALEHPGDWNRLSKAISLCQQLNMQETLEKTVKPVFRKQARALTASQNISQLTQIYYTCQSMGANDIIQENIKPALKHYFLRAKDQPVNTSEAYQSLILARTLQLKEAVPLAVKARLSQGDRRLRPWPGHPLCRPVRHQGAGGPAGTAAERHSRDRLGRYQLGDRANPGARRGPGGAAAPQWAETGRLRLPLLPDRARHQPVPDLRQLLRFCRGQGPPGRPQEVQGLAGKAEEIMNAKVDA